MLTRLSLRLRIFLFFCLLAVAGAGLAGAAMAFGWSRADETLPTSPFITAFVLFAFLNTGLVAAIWLLFDEHVAKPINRLSAKLRLGAHPGTDTGTDTGPNTGVDTEIAKYLGDLAPAADALSRTASASVTETAAQIARDTNRLRVETERLTAVLTEAPVATILLNAALKIVLYDQQAAEVMSSIALPRLRAPISDYFDEDDLSNALAQLSADTTEVQVTLRDTTGTQTFEARLKALSNEGYMIFFDETAPRVTQIEARPLVFDFDLMDTPEGQDIADTPLSALCFVPFDTETTGLSVQNDDVIQLGAVRVLNGRIVDGEAIDAFVNPGRPIPPGSTKIHKITDAHVADAADIATVGRAFHHFARDAVLVAHNAPFDIGLLRKSAPQMGVEWNHPVLDTVLLSAVVFGTTEEHTLDALCDRLSITIPTQLRHTALGDAQATAQALVKLLPLLDGKGITTFGQLLTETRKHSRLLQDLND